MAVETIKTSEVVDATPTKTAVEQFNDNFRQESPLAQDVYSDCLVPSSRCPEHDTVMQCLGCNHMWLASNLNAFGLSLVACMQLDKTLASG